MTTELVRYDAMCRAIADTYELDEVKDIRDRAIALEAYARQAKNFEAEDRCKEIRLRAERKWGQLYSVSDKASGGQPYQENSTGRSGRPVEIESKTLRDMGVSKDQSSRWQKLGAVPDDEFEAAVAERRVEQLIAKPAGPITQVDADVLWLWGRLREFRERALLDKTPSELAKTATPHMIEEIGELAPPVASWLSRWSDYYV
jgi:hypothetical protein